MINLQKIFIFENKKPLCLYRMRLCKSRLRVIDHMEDFRFSDKIGTLTSYTGS